MPFPVAVLGDLNWDLVLRTEEFPLRGKEALVQSFSLRLGGSATNTARWLARLGFKVRLLAAVGEDLLGELALQKLKEEGISPRFIQRHPESTGLCLALVDGKGERTLFTSRGANAYLSAPLPKRWLLGVRWLHLSGYSLLEPSSREVLSIALLRAKAEKIPVSLDPGMVAVHGHGEILRSLGPVDVFLPNREEALALVGGIFSQLREFGQRGFLKLGPEGCWAWEGEREIRVPAIPIEARNPVGAGDAFNAGVIAASILGGDLLAQAGLGNLLGALAASERSFSSGTLIELSQALPKEVNAALQPLLSFVPVK